MNYRRRSEPGGRDTHDADCQRQKSGFAMETRPAEIHRALDLPISGGPAHHAYQPATRSQQNQRAGGLAKQVRGAGLPRVDHPSGQHDQP